ncbi:MAG: hypothetical protein OXP71_18000 [Candidatus Poribacteria bacterium]|nr:hypothetical protein [Candidatus Poribacteria bacterium]
MRQIKGEKLKYTEHQHSEEIKRQESVESEISVSVECLPGGLADAEKLIDLVDELMNRLIWVFNVNDHARRDKVEAILRRCELA